MNFKLLKSGFVVVLGMVVASLVHAATPLKLQDTGNKHNLSVGATWNPIRAEDNADPRRTQICIFCHTPHNADSTQAPLWSHADQDASVTFQMASSSYVTPGSDSWADTQPQGISKKCLSCHDGTVAIGALANGSAITVTGGGAGGGTQLGGTRTAPTWESTGDAGFIGTDLRGGHVISFKYSDETGGTNSFLDSDPPSKSNFNLWNDIAPSDQSKMFDRQRKMHCHTCHDPHTDWCDDGSKTIGGDPLWRKLCDAGKNSSVCVVCHKQVTFQIYTFPW